MRRMGDDGGVSAFLELLDEPTRARLAASAPTELPALCDAARRRWPDIEVSREHFHAFLAARAGGIERVGALRVDDLYLACACLEGVPAALPAFEALLTEVADCLRHLTAGSEDLLEEAKQATRQLLLPRADRQPALASYTGRGNLGGWLRVALGREIVRLQRAGAAVTRLDSGELRKLADDDDDPETAYLKTHYQREFKEAFAAAVVALEPAERRLLRYAVIERLSIDDIATLERVHRATAARQVARARQRLAEETRRILRERLRLEAGQLQSVLALIESQLEVSVQRLLATREERSAQ
jgi:RNA polymerase sigma-70 factor (ECF subfamily)